MAGRLLRAIGATPGITETLGGYVETAVTLAAEPTLLAQYRTLFTEANWAATIGDIVTFTYHYEQSLIQIETGLRKHDVTESEPIRPELAEAVAA